MNFVKVRRCAAAWAPGAVAAAARGARGALRAPPRDRRLRRRGARLRPPAALPRWGPRAAARLPARRRGLLGVHRAVDTV